MVGLGRLELPTSRLSSARSNQLSYKPLFSSRTSYLDSHHLLSLPHLADTAKIWWRRSGSNRRPEACKATALPTELRPPAVSQNYWYTGTGPLCSGRDKPAATSSHRQENALRKEVIQPQVPLRLPCYDFTPVADLTVVVCPLTVGETPSGKTNSHGVTGGVYKARERIHRGMLIRDY